MPPKEGVCSGETGGRTILCIFSAELTSSCGGHDTKMGELGGGGVGDDSRWNEMEMEGA